MTDSSNKSLIGSIDHIDLPHFGLEDVACKIDTGAKTSTLHCSKVHLLEKDGVDYLCFTLYDPKFDILNKEEFRFRDFKERKVRSSNGMMEERYSIETTVVIFGRKIKTEFTLSFREKMRYPILLGRRFLKGRFLVDVARNNLSYNEKING